MPDAPINRRAGFGDEQPPEITRRGATADIALRTMMFSLIVARESERGLESAAGRRDSEANRRRAGGEREAIRRRAQAPVTAAATPWGLVRALVLEPVFLDLPGCAAALGIACRELVKLGERDARILAAPATGDRGLRVLAAPLDRRRRASRRSRALRSPLVHSEPFPRQQATCFGRHRQPRCRLHGVHTDLLEESPRFQASIRQGAGRPEPAPPRALLGAESLEARLLAVARHCTDRFDIVDRVKAMSGVIDRLSEHESKLDDLVTECCRAAGVDMGGLVDRIRTRAAEPAAGAAGAAGEEPESELVLDLGEWTRVGRDLLRRDPTRFSGFLRSPTRPFACSRTR